MPVSLQGVKTSAGIPEELRGKALKDWLVESLTPFMVTDVTVQDNEFGESWEVAISYVKDGEEQTAMLYLSLHGSRDAELEAMRDATRDDTVGPLVLTRSGKKGWLDFQDADVLVP